MKECTRHRDAVVRFGDYWPNCPLCTVLRQVEHVVRTGKLTAASEVAQIAEALR